MPSFLIFPGGDPIDGVLVYVRDDYGFDFRPSRPEQMPEFTQAACTSLLVGTLQMEVGVTTNRALFVWGYHPFSQWQNGPVEPPPVSPGLVQVTGLDLEVGISEALVDVNEWLTAYDPASGWVHVAQNPFEPAADAAVEFASGCLCGVKEDALVELWLKPIFE